MNTVTDSLAIAAHLIASADPALLHIVALSLRVSGTACLLGATIGLVLGAALAVFNIIRVRRGPIVNGD